MSGLVKPKEYKVSDSNIANLGSDLEKNVRLAAAGGEVAWHVTGKDVGLWVWRIEQFKVVPWPKEQYGQFFDGDSYIVLKTYREKDAPKLKHDIHFWLGKYTSQDEAGTAAYKTVELDDYLGTEPVQHREVQGHESDLFMTYFTVGGSQGIRIMEGGTASGFKHVEEKKNRHRLLHLKGKKKIRVQEVEKSGASLNSGDVFVLDADQNIYQWNGNKAGIFEKNRGATLTRALSDERGGKAKIHVCEEKAEPEEFWAGLGGKPAKIKTAEEGGSDEEAEKGGEKKLFQLSDASGKMEFKEIATGNNIKRSQLDGNDVFIFDSGNEVWAWIGKGASVEEKKKSMGFAQDYITKYNRPAYLPISRVLEGGENAVFEGFFHTA